MLPGNRVALRHGLSATQVHEELAREREEFVSASVADDGGPNDISTRRRSLHGYRGRLHVHIGQVSAALETFGVFDKRGRLRVTWIQQLANLIDRARGLDQTLGLERRAKHAPTSLAEALRAAPILGGDDADR